MAENVTTNASRLIMKISVLEFFHHGCNFWLAFLLGIERINERDFITGSL